MILGATREAQSLGVRNSWRERQSSDAANVRPTARRDLFVSAAQSEAESQMWNSLRVELQKWLPGGSLSQHGVEEMDLAVFETDCEDMPAVSRRVSEGLHWRGKASRDVPFVKSQGRGDRSRRFRKAQRREALPVAGGPDFDLQERPIISSLQTCDDESQRSHCLVSRRGCEESSVRAPTGIPNDACM